MTVLVVDAANVVGSRPDGWWRDRAGATDAAARCGWARCRAGRSTVRTVRAVHRGRRPWSRAGRATCPAPDGIRVVRASGSGDDALVEYAAGWPATASALLVVTADRGLRARLPDGVAVAGSRLAAGAARPDRLRTTGMSATGRG